MMVLAESPHLLKPHNICPLTRRPTLPFTFNPLWGSLGILDIMDCWDWISWTCWTTHCGRRTIGSWGRPPIHSHSGSQGFTEASHHLPYSAFHYLNWGGGEPVYTSHQSPFSQK